MAEAIAIFAVVWGWALLLLGFGALAEWVAGGRRRKRGDILRAPEDPKDQGADT